ncbi:MAG: peptide ABC transporter substrate-binding protein [Ruminococcaceae bacterium]|nr:peptide ABC transporter substrate-binding protein [Oscillospiraceae bacterium]
MKKILALTLCLVMLVPVLAGCGKIKPTDDDKGAEIPVYLTDPVFNLDPAFAYLDDGAVEILQMVFEGLYTLDAKGKPREAMCNGYKTFTDRDGNFVCEFSLNETKWSDGRYVTAGDFVYAWKRILEPGFSSPAASLLFDIKNARACKNGDVTIDDLGVVAIETRVLQVTFERKIDIEQFIMVTASPALVPLYEDKVNRQENWASSYVTMATNGAYFVKLFTPGSDSLVLERNIHYYRDAEKARFLDTKVKPYRINIHFNTPEEALAEYNKGEIVLNSNLALSARSSASGVETLETLSTHTYVFNTRKAPFDNADVRKALSLAIDRDELVKQIVYAEASEGIIPTGVFDTSKKTSFRENGGKLISTKADMTEAKKLAKGADVTEFTLTIREGDVIAATVAEYAVKQWKQLGFDVTVVTKGFTRADENEYEQYNDDYTDAYLAGDFDVIATDSTMLSTYAFADLACFAKPFSGGALDLASGNYDPVTHVSGYDNKEYDELIEKAFAEKDASKRSKLLHRAEEMLCEDMPVAPLFTYDNVYAVSKDLKKFKTTYYGGMTFVKSKLKNYEDYKETNK